MRSGKLSSMLLVEFGVVAVSCQLNWPFLLPPKTYAVARSTKARFNTTSHRRSGRRRRDRV